MIDWDFLEVSPEVALVRAELMLRGVIVVHERDRRMLVTSPTEERAHRVVAELLGDDYDVEWLGPTNHRIIPARVISYEHFPINTVYLTVEATADELVDCAYAAEDEEKVVVAAFKCSPHYCDRGPDKPQLERVLLDGDLDGRPVIDALTGEVLPSTERAHKSGR
jgi:hypothetical protein